MKKIMELLETEIAKTEQMVMMDLRNQFGARLFELLGQKPSIDVR